MLSCSLSSANGSQCRVSVTGSSLYRWVIGIQLCALDANFARPILMLQCLPPWSSTKPVACCLALGFWSSGLVHSLGIQYWVPWILSLAHAESIAIDNPYDSAVALQPAYFDCCWCYSRFAEHILQVSTSVDADLFTSMVCQIPQIDNCLSFPDPLKNIWTVPWSWRPCKEKKLTGWNSGLFTWALKST